MEKLKDLVESVELRDINRLREAVDLWEISDLEQEPVKELSFCHKLYFSNLFIFATQCRRPLIFQTMNSVTPNILSLKYQWFT